MMYLKKFNRTMTLRLSDNQMDFIIAQSQKLCMSPSEFIRGLIDSVAIKCHMEEGELHADNQTDKHDIV